MSLRRPRRGNNDLVLRENLADACRAMATGAAISMLFLYGFGLYLVLGVITAVAFVSLGVTQVQPYSMTLGARILLLPGATALWPYVLVRWLKSRRAA
jgi:hypothetical protein